MAASKTRVFVSYSWDVEENTNIVDKLEPLCQAIGIELIRDRNRLRHGDLISEFMDELVASDHIITVFSKEYLESEYCMYELLEIYRRSGANNFQSRIHPFIADNTVLSDFDTQLKYIKYWEDKERIVGIKLKTVDPIVSIRLRERHKIYQDIYREINNLMCFVGDILVTPIDALHHKAFAPLLDSIKPSGIPTFPILQDDQCFIKEILEAIESILSDTECLCIDLIKKYHLPKNTDVRGVVSKAIQEQCEHKITSLIRNITNLTINRLKNFEGKKAYKKAKKLLEASENLVALISLLGIPREQAEKLYLSSLDMVLSHEAQGSAEITFARKVQSSPKFRMGNPHILGKHATTSNELLESGIDEDNSIEEVIKQVCAKVLPNQDIKVVGEQFLRDQIKLELESDNQRKKNYYFLISASELGGHNIFTNPSVIAELKQRLPELPIITLKYKSDSLGYVTSDRLLMAEIYNFYNEINTYKS